MKLKIMHHKLGCTDGANFVDKSELDQKKNNDQFCNNAHNLKVYDYDN
jgi:hypothetical protein